MNQIYPEITITLTSAVGATPATNTLATLNDEDDLYARWQTEDSPCFPRPLCVALPPKRPARQTTEGNATTTQQQCGGGSSSSSVDEGDNGVVVVKESSSCLDTTGPQSATATSTAAAAAAPRRPRRRVTLEKGSLQKPAALARQATPPPPPSLQHPRFPIRQQTGNFNRSSITSNSSNHAFLFSSHDNAIEEISNDSSSSSSTSSQTDFCDDDDESSVDQTDIMMTMSLSHRFNESTTMALSHRFDESIRLDDDVMGSGGESCSNKMDYSLRDLSPCRPTRQRTSTRKTTSTAAAAAIGGGDATVSSSTATSTGSSSTSYGGGSRRVSNGCGPTSPFADTGISSEEQPEWVKLWESQGAGGGGGTASLVWDF